MFISTRRIRLVPSVPPDVAYANIPEYQRPEADAAGVVVGLGLNLFWPDPPAGYGAWLETQVSERRVNELADAFAQRLFDRVAAGPADWGQGEYRAACVTLGRQIRWEPDGAGTARDVAPDGSLLVETEAGIETITAGEVWEVRTP